MDKEAPYLVMMSNPIYGWEIIARADTLEAAEAEAAEYSMSYPTCIQHQTTGEGAGSLWLHGIKYKIVEA
jgi:hypothetical protein